MDKSARFTNKPKGPDYCNKPGTSCYYGPGDICVNCGRKKGWKRQGLTSKAIGERARQERYAEQR